MEATKYIKEKIFPIPKYIKELESFGVGEFSEEEKSEKIKTIKQLLDSREKNENPFLSVVVPAYREEKGVLATMLSLAQQEYQDVEFIFVVNGEEKNSKTEQIINSAGFKVIYEEEAGISNARQKGADQAKGKFIINTDADTLHEKDWLQNIAKVIKEKNLIRGAATTRALSSGVFIELYTFSYWQKQKLNDLLGFLGFENNNLFFSGIDEANSWVSREELNKAEGWNKDVQFNEGYELFTRLPKGDESDIIHFDKGLKVYTSGRRFEQQSSLDIISILIRQRLSRMMKGKELDISHEEYADYR